MNENVVKELMIQNKKLKKEIEQLKKIISLYDADSTGKVTKEWVKLVLEGKLKFVE